MNQILSTENISNKGKYNKGSQKDIKTVIKFFAIKITKKKKFQQQNRKLF